MTSKSGQQPVCVITGAGRGIGRAAALALARGGWTVALVARSWNELAAAADEIRDEGAEAACYVTDVSKLESVRKSIEAICREQGTPSGLVNNAAVIGPVAPVSSADPVAWKATLETNLLGAFYFVQGVLEAMMQQQRGMILNVVSGMGERVFPRFSAYSVSKAGLIHLTRILAEEVRPYGVTVNALDPGMVQTSMQETLAKMSPEVLGAEMHENLKRAGKGGLLKPPEMIGDWIARFFSDQALSLIHI